MATDSHPKEKETLQPRSSTGATLVLQWLTYAFWGWLIGGLVWLLSVILVNVIVGDSVNGVIPYAVAASVVLLPLAFVCDLFYRRHEPLRKNGAAMVIMLIHAVIYALLAIGALIVTVFTGLNALINTVGDSASAITVVIIVSAASTLLYAALFLRVLNPFKKKLGASLYAWAMLGVTVILLIWGIVGPIAQSVATRHDRTTEEGVTSLSYAIQSYTADHKALPQNLSDISTGSDAANALIKDNKVQYTPGTVDPTMSNDYYSSYRYQLCVSYDHAVKSPTPSYDSPYGSSDGYSSTINTTSHDAGRVCYKLRT